MKKVFCQILRIDRDACQYQTKSCVPLDWDPLYESCFLYLNLLDLSTSHTSFHYVFTLVIAYGNYWNIGFT